MRRRPTERGRTVGITGADAGLGRAVLDRLAARTDIASARGVPISGRGALKDIDVLVHLDTTYDGQLPAADRHRRNVVGTQQALRAARAAGVRRIVLVTSADVYGAAAGNEVPLPDDAPVAAQAGSDLLGDHVAVEQLVAGADDVAVLRPASLVGGPFGPAYDGAQLRLLTAPRLLAARGHEPLWQLCHSEDLVRAIEVAVVADLVGPLPVGCTGWLTQTDVERLTGKRRIELPAAVAQGTAERLQRLGLSTSSPRELDHLTGPVVVGSDRLRAAGWEPLWTNEAALRAHLADRAGSPGRAGAYTAAGATVALLGTAALVRQARRQRRGI